MQNSLLNQNNNQQRQQYQQGYPQNQQYQFPNNPQYQGQQAPYYNNQNPPQNNQQYNMNQQQNQNYQQQQPQYYQYPQQNQPQPQIEVTQQTNEEAIPFCGMINMKYYQQFFNTTTEIVVRRLLIALTIFKYKDFEGNFEKVDFYGPFWIYATMAFALSFSQNLYSLLIKPPDQKFKYSIEYLPKSFLVIYAFGFLCPLFYNLIIRAFGGYIEYYRVVTIYGYSQVVNVLTLLLCALPNATFQNFVIIWGALHSSFFFVLCLKDKVLIVDDTQKKVSLAAMIFCQITIIIIYKKYFFGDLYGLNQLIYINEKRTKYNKNIKTKRIQITQKIEIA